ncbi:hypothetical protein FACS1894169_06150 [Bacteroidia bacterium]|nr:hypothetical protein FACS1894169_06150 [Bacteroidia bacterium]
MNRQYNKRQIINNAFLRWMYILILCLGSMGIYGQQQTYPVQVYTQLIPPYTPHIPAYYIGTQAKLKVMLINTDMQQPVVNVYLRMKILSSSFSAVTPPEIYTPQIELQAGMPITLSLNDLEPYFKKENLRVSGGQSEFYRTQMLPDNFYRFHFEVYEAGTNRLVSNPKIGFAQAMIASGEPPILNLPQKGSVIKESAIPSIMFSWTPKHMNSIAAAYGTEYDISLVEIYDKQVAPEAAFDYSRVLYTETTKSTSFIHTVAQPLLIPGMRYAWRVQAKAREGVDEISVFKNNGYSPVSWFDYTADCKTVQSSGAIYENGHVDISWQDVGAMEYTVEYRKKGTSRWYTGTINKPLLSQLYNLQAGKDYEYRIGSRCVAGDAFRYNDLQAFHIPDRQENGPNCGLMPDISLTNRTPTRELQSGMPVLVGDFPVFITKVSGSGKFTGEGYVGIPYLQGAQIAVTFKDIVVNTDNRLVSGYFETKYDTKNNNLLFDADQYQTGGKGVGDIRSGEEQAAFKVDYTINPDIKALPVKADGTKDEIKEGTDYTISKGENGKYTFVLTDSEGKEHKVEADAMPATIEDKNGNTYEVSEKGEVKPVSKNSDIKLDSSTKDTQSKLASLSFKATPNTKYALDEYRPIYEKVTEYYVNYKVEGTQITASAKFMLPGASDEIAVYIKENKDNKLQPEKVRFVTGKGKEYSATYDNQTKEWTLTIVGGQANDGQELYVVQDVGKDKYETLGKLNIFTYEPLKRSVTLVPVNGKNNNLDRQTVQDGLNEIYGKIGISWTVNILEKPFSYTPKNGSTFNVTGSGLLSMFTDDMKAINEAFKQSGEYQEDGLYLFVIGDKASESGTEGDMPLGSQFGYLFPNATIRTIAHEVGHGAFNLEHPFDRPGRNSFSKGDLKDNLMEYGTGTELVKLQWDQTRAPGHVIGLFQKDKSGMIISNAYYWTPSGHIIYLKDPSKGVTNTDMSAPNGTLYGFIENGIKYTARIDNNLFYGYQTEDGKIYNDSQTLEKLKTEKEKITVVSRIYNGDCTVSEFGNIVPLQEAIALKDYTNGVPVRPDNKYYLRKEEKGSILNIVDCNGKLQEYGQKLYDANLSKANTDEAKNKLFEIALLADKMGKTYFEDILQGKKWDSNPESSTSYFAYYWALLKDKPEYYTTESLTSLKNLLEKYIAAVEKLNSISKDANCSKDEILSIINDYFVFGQDYKYLFNAPIAALDATQRKNILQSLSLGFVSGRVNVGSSWQEEDVILEVFHTTPAEQQKALLEAIYQQKLLYRIVNGVDGGNFDKVIETIARWVIQYYPCPTDMNVSEKIENKQILLFNDNYFGRINNEYVSETGNVSLAVKKWSGDTEYQVTASPYDYLLVKFKNTFEIGDSRFISGTTYKLPALYVYMLFNADTRQKWQTSGKVAVDIGLLALGAGEVRAAMQAGNWARTALAVADIGIGFTDVVVNTAFKNEIQEGYPEFYDNWQKISLAYGLGRITQVGLEAAYKRANIESWVMKTDVSLSQETRQAANKINQRLQDQAYFGAEFVDDGVREINKLEGQVQAIESQMIVDGRELNAEAVNKYYSNRGITMGKRSNPPAKLGTLAHDKILPVNSKLYAIEEVDQLGPGGWLTDEKFNTLEEGREKLALIDEFKSSSKQLVLVEYTVIKPMPTRVSIVGEQYCNVAKKIYNGSANQYEFRFAYAFTQRPDSWKEYLVKTEINGNKYIKALNF